MPEIIEKDGCKFNLIDGIGASVLEEIFDKNVYGFADVPNSGAVLDIGANLGAFSIRCAIQKNCMVYSYEPGIRNFEVLNDNIFLNGVFNKVKAFNLAISDDNKARNFYYRKNHPAGSTLFADGLDMDANIEQYMVPCVTLEDIFSYNKLSQVDFLKMDAEGAEQLVFTPKFHYILRKVKLIALEWHAGLGKELADFFNAIGFTTTITDPSFSGGILKARNNYAS
jgi:FkbM family methyltransferase